MRVLLIAAFVAYAAPVAAQMNVSSPVPISAATLPLPTGAATETGNLANIKTDADRIDIALSALRDALTNTAISGKSLNDLYVLIGSIRAADGSAAPANSDVVAGTDAQGTTRTLATTPNGVLTTLSVPVPTLPPAVRCNALRKTNCS